MASPTCVGGILKVLVSFYRHGEEQAFERHRSRVTFDQEKHLNINSMRKHLRDFLGLPDLTKKFGMPDFEIKLFRLSRSSGKVENYNIVTQKQWGVEMPLLLVADVNQNELNGRSLLGLINIFCLHTLDMSFMSRYVCIILLKYIFDISLFSYLCHLRSPSMVFVNSILCV